ncbi:hypothetical protein FHX75_13658 [Micromonospora palomenae]|uniref:Uncharacterized protein n=1 Tax=Micromonospora palomenae TaxID=1461247 RepID=A0A561VPQ7_9ACTN|nr:hypothetical protein [Micromonospora palomenae]TWG13611.1 hypothetical protein FHX75_13658 [Micromonospora palomenae]
MRDIDAVWATITQHAGQTFLTVSGLPFRYIVDGDRLLTDRTSYWIHRSQLKTALDLWPVAGPAALHNVVRGPSYLFALLADRRIMPDY